MIMWRGMRGGIFRGWWVFFSCCYVVFSAPRHHPYLFMPPGVFFSALHIINIDIKPTLLGQTHAEASWYKIPAYLNQNTTLPPALWSSFNLASFTCPTAFAALTRSSFSIPVWRFRYFGDWDNLRFYGPSAGKGNEEGSGAYHGSDVQMVVGNSVGVSGGVGKSEEEGRMEGVMGGAWAAFARDPRKGLEGWGWGRYGVGEGGLVKLGEGGKGEATFRGGDTYDGGCGDVTLEG